MKNLQLLIIKTVTHLTLASSIILTSITAKAGDSSSTFCSKDSDADGRFFYIGLDGGLSMPLRNHFRQLNKALGKSVKVNMKRTKKYTAKIGYSFYPQMFLEFAYTHQPRYKLSYLLPVPLNSSGSKILPTPGRTNVKVQLHMLSLIYNFEPINKWTPFVMIGGGMAKVKVKESLTCKPGTDHLVFRVHKKKMNCFATQGGIGLARDITDNFRLEAMAKIQIVTRAKIDFSQADPKLKKFVNQKH